MKRINWSLQRRFSEKKKSFANTGIRTRILPTAFLLLRLVFCVTFLSCARSFLLVSLLVIGILAFYFQWTLSSGQGAVIESAKGAAIGGNEMKKNYLS